MAHIEGGIRGWGRIFVLGTDFRCLINLSAELLLEINSMQPTIIMSYQAATWNFL